MSKVFTNLAIQKLDILRHAIHLMTTAVQNGSGVECITQLNTAINELSDVLLHSVEPVKVEPVPVPKSAPTPVTQPKKK